MPENTMYVVGIGASAGGLDPIQQLFSSIDNYDNDNMAFVIIQHLSADFKSLMPELLSKHTKMKIFTATDNQKIEPNCIYLNPRDKNIIVEKDRLILQDKLPREKLNLPINIFFNSLGNVYKEKSIGIVLSGTGSDGTRGIKSIKEAGGCIVVQDPSTAQFDGMPNSAISTNLADFILSPNAIGDFLSKFSNKKIEITGNIFNILKSDDEIFIDILDELVKSSSIDFRLYKRNTLLRRIEKRMQLNNIDKLHDYFVFIQNNIVEKEMLKQDFLIGVTSFFRDEEAFYFLQHNIIPELCFNKQEGDFIRVWIAGCSTGEEVYSIAMLLYDYIKKNKLSIDFKIFATDVDMNALKKAGIGKYNIGSISELDRYYQDNYLTIYQDYFIINKKIRDKIIFSNHDLLKDPPFIRTDLVVCRNLLIYLENKTQKKVLMSFQFSLNYHGYLFLGHSESLGEVSHLFETVNNKWKIYQNISSVKHLSYRENLSENKIPFVHHKQDNSLSYNALPMKMNSETTFQEHLSDIFSPSCIFIDTKFNVLFIHGDAGKKLNFAQGLFQNNLLKLVNPTLKNIIRTGIKKINVEKKNVTIKNIVNITEQGNFCFDLMFHKVDDMYLIQFSDDNKIDDTIVLENGGIEDVSKEYITDIEQELKETKHKLQSAIEELETSNEELQSSNEELMASNEELQSTNEELQSVNEELYTVNTELQEKNRGMKLLADDISVLLDNTEIGTLFLDTNLNIRNFTKALTKHFKLESKDIGRYIGDFVPNFSDAIRHQFLKDAKNVFKIETMIEREVIDEQGVSYLLKTSPFFTREQKIEGLVVTLVNISKLKETEEVLRKKTYELDKAQEISKVGSWFYDIKTNRLTWSKQIYESFGLNHNSPPPSHEMQERFFTPESWNLLSSSFNKAIKEGISYNLELQIIKNNRSTGWIHEIGEAVRNDNDEIYALRGVSQDITERKILMENIQREKLFSEKLLDVAPIGVYIFDLEKNKKIFINTEYVNITGYSLEDINNMSSEEYQSIYPTDYDKIIQSRNEIRIKKTQLELEYQYKHKKGNLIWCYLIYTPFEYNSNGEVKSFIGVFMDTTKRKTLEQELKHAKIKAEEANIQKNLFLANMSHEVRTPISGILGFTELLKKVNLTQDEKNHFLDVIDSNTKQLLVLLDDIIDISKIEIGEIEIKIDQYDINQIIKDSLEVFKMIKTQKNKDHIVLKTNILENQKIIIDTDYLRLKQVISNLLNNALKFTEKGEIEIGYELENDYLNLYIKDTGIGIPKNELEVIFERFRQSKNNNPNQYKGTGLGLSISQGIVNLLKGKIFVESELGKGTIFHIELPLKNSSAERVITFEKDNCYTEENIKLTKDKVVLIVEDDELILLYLKNILKLIPVNVLYAYNGEDAIELVKNKPIDIILMDLGLPKIDGYKATEEILKIYPNMKVIAHSAFVMEKNIEKCISLGFCDFIPKPANSDIILNKIIKWLMVSELK